MRDDDELVLDDFQDEALTVDSTVIVLEDDDEETVDRTSAEYVAAFNFFAAIWGADAQGALKDFHFIAEKKAVKGFEHYARHKVPSAISVSFERSALWRDIYFACAQFATFNGTNHDNRTQANALGAYSFWLDVDCGSDKPYLTQAEGAAALKAFCASSGLPKPSIVIDSGRGLHCYWHFNEFIDRPSWVLHATQLERLTKIHNFVVDPNRTKDIASVLRVPGTKNWKDHANPKSVAILRSAPALNFSQFVAQLYANAPTAPMAAQQATASVAPAGGATSIARVYPPSSAHEIVKHCATLAHFEAVGGAVSEPLWRNALGVLKYTDEGDPLCHQWSTGDPRYDPSETQEKIDKWKTPPTRCDTFRRLSDAKCGGCSQTCRSPIQLGHSAADVVTDFSWHYFVSKVGGNVYVFDERDDDLLSGGMSFTTFRNLHSNVFVNQKLAASEWLKSSTRRAYDKLVFDPQCNHNMNAYNLWRGLAVQPAKGPYHLILRHILFVLCGGNRAQFRYLMRWFALAVQKPWAKPEVALVLRSKEGSGKTIVVDMVRDFFGAHGFVTAQKEQVAGRFNGHLFDKVFVVLEEAFFAGDPAAVASAKALITNSHIGYEAKGKDAFTAPNYATVVLLTNNDWAVPAGEDARRWAVLDVSNMRLGDYQYFLDLNFEIKNGGAEAFLDLLLRLDLRGFNPRQLPKTGAMRQQRVQTLLHSDPVAAWWLEVLSEGEFPLKNGSIDWDVEISSGDMQESYGVTTAGARHPPPVPVAMKRLRELVPGGPLPKVRKGTPGDRYFAYQLPVLADARLHFQNVTGIDPCAP